MERTEIKEMGRERNSWEIQRRILGYSYVWNWCSFQSIWPLTTRWPRAHYPERQGRFDNYSPMFPQVPVLSTNPSREDKELSELSVDCSAFKPETTNSQLGVLTTKPRRCTWVQSQKVIYVKRKYKYQKITWKGRIATTLVSLTRISM